MANRRYQAAEYLRKCLSYIYKGNSCHNRLRGRSPEYQWSFTQDLHSRTPPIWTASTLPSKATQSTATQARVCPQGLTIGAPIQPLCRGLYMVRRDIREYGFCKGSQREGPYPGEVTPLLPLCGPTLPWRGFEINRSSHLKLSSFDPQWALMRDFTVWRIFLEFDPLERVPCSQHVHPRGTCYTIRAIWKTHLIATEYHVICRPTYYHISD